LFSLEQLIFTLWNLARLYLSWALKWVVLKLFNQLQFFSSM
jgi:hypothetical protein